jgi:hypothetical protein
MPVAIDFVDELRVAWRRDIIYADDITCACDEVWFFQSGDRER